MNSLLFLISFILHIISITTIFLLFQQIQAIKHNQKEQIERMLHHFVEEIREENERLQAKLQSNLSPQQRDLNESMKELNRHTKERNRNVAAQLKQNEKIENVTNKMVQTEKREDKVETSLESKILQLHEQGLSHEEIAKKMNRGKTEIELFLKMMQHK